MATLLENAKSVKTKNKQNRISKEVIELSLSWALDEITIGQAASALNKNGSSTYIILALALKKYVYEKNNQ